MSVTIAKEFPDAGMSPWGRKNRDSLKFDHGHPTTGRARGYNREGRRYIARDLLHLRDDPELNRRRLAIVNAHARPRAVRAIFKANVNAVGKRANWYRELADPRVVGQVLRPGRHPQAWALGGAGAAGAAAHAEPVQRRAGRHDMAADAAIGALAGQTAYQAGGYAPSHYARRKIGWNTRASTITDPTAKAQHKAEDKMRKTSIRAHTDPATGRIDWTGHYRAFPAEHRYARVFRTVGRTHRGRTGVAIGAAATVAGASLGARHGRREMVGKAAELGVREKKTRPLRAAEFATGAAGVVWGGPRLKMVGPAIQRGARLAQAHGGANAARATVFAADTARRALIAGTAPLEQTRRLARVNHLVETVPTALRPAVATVAGAVLAAHAMPVRRDVFAPVKEN